MPLFGLNTSSSVSEPTLSLSTFLLLTDTPTTQLISGIEHDVETYSIPINITTDELDETRLASFFQNKHSNNITQIITYETLTSVVT